MKPGDLVQLSSYGRSRGFNSYLSSDKQSRVGIVIKIEKGKYPYIVQWTGIKSPQSSRDRHSRKELKHASR